MDTVKRLLSLTLAVSLAAIPFSCKSFDPKLLEQRASFGEGVPAMRVVVNTDSIKECFKGGWRDRNELKSLLIKHKFWGIPAAQKVSGFQFYACCSFPEQEMIVNLIRHNLSFERDTKNVYLSVLVRKVEWKRNGLWIFLGPITAGFFYFFGGPSLSYTITIDMEAAVMKSDGRVLKTYSARGVDSEYKAFYWGYYETEMLIPLYVNGMINTCADLRKQIEADKDNLNRLVR